MNCPECGDALKVGAKRCGCGWTYGPVKEQRPTTVARNWDCRCTYESHGERCRYPVGWYDAGATDGWCIFHRTHDARDQQKGAEIVARSRATNPESYLGEAQKLAYGDDCPAQFKELQERAAKVQDDKRLFKDAA